MEAIKDSLASMAEMFNTKMTAFQNDLQKTSTPLTTASLAADFNVFQSFILSALTTLQRQVEYLGKEIERQEMRRRRKMLLFHGVPEVKSEDLKARITSLVAEHLDLTNFASSSITTSYRLGRSSVKKPRPIVVKFAEQSIRNQVWYAKTKLKGSGITQSEFLTKSRHEVFLAARQRFGIGKCWTRDGWIHIIASDESQHRVESLAELDAISQQTPKSPTTVETSKSPVAKIPVARTKRVIKK
ncbi:uncharacterized protein LOC124538862 [Vanessa cardui]|uniref:uncharacterized protein LOC124529794 n=1 Tax=Vanessa cardui TaxID=171605 RepID=UPI001F141A14|nr:uncharacterized protein LOC124529794 [Vanessa cardui]XP_046972053.1 uncharacterized protein LOC124538862 [Vanessa cardui]